MLPLISQPVSLIQTGRINSNLTGAFAPSCSLEMWEIKHEGLSLSDAADQTQMSSITPIRGAALLMCIQPALKSYGGILTGTRGMNQGV